MRKTTVVHCRKDYYDVYIGRPSIWGNPFEIGRHGTREQVIEKYREHILNDPLLRSQLMDLHGKVLGCWCRPAACHGDVLVDLIEQIKTGTLKI